jgi:hypothetical protein
MNPSVFPLLAGTGALQTMMPSPKLSKISALSGLALALMLAQASANASPALMELPSFGATM